MKRPIFYLNALYVFLLLTLILGCYYYYGENVSFEKNNLQFVSITRSEAFDPREAPLAFMVLKDKQPTEVFVFHGNENLGLSKYYQYEITDNKSESQEILYLALTKSLPLKDSIEVQNIQDLITQYQNSEIKAVRLIQYNFENGFSGFINNSPFVIFLYFIMLFVMLWVLDYIFHFSNLIKVIQISKFFIYSVFLISICGLFRGIQGAWYPSSDVAEFILMVTIILPIFILYQYLNNTRLHKMKWYDAEMIKFMLVFVGTILLFIIGNEIAYLYDKLQLKHILRMPLINRRTVFIFGIALAFSLANLLNNLRRDKRLF